MFCSKCGKEIEKAAFCPYCGAKQDDEKVVKTKSEKKKGKGWIVVCIILLLMIGAAGVGIRHYILQGIPDKYIRLIQEGRTEEAQSLYNEKIAGNDQQLETAYQKVSENIKKIKRDFADGSITYEDAKAELSEYSSFYKAEVNNAISDLDRLKKSKNAFQQAEKNYQNEEYEKAYKLYQDVKDDDVNYSSAQERLKECYGLITEQAFKIADDYSNQKKYGMAISQLENKKEIMNSTDATKATEKIKEYKELYLNEKQERINEFIKEEDYKNAYSTIKQMEQDGFREIAGQIREGLDDAYIDYITKEINNNIKNDQLENAIGILNIAKKRIGDRDELIALEDVIKEYQPVRMVDMDTFYYDGNKNYVYEWGAGDRDNIGDSGYWGYRYCVMDTGWQDGNEWKYREWKYTYLIDGKYDNFDAVLATSEESKDYISDNYDAYIEVYNGDMLIYTSEKTRGGVKPLQIHATITNAQEVTVVVKGRAFNCGGSKKFEVGLLNPTFSKNRNDIESR